MTDEIQTTADEPSIQCPDCGINWWLFPPATVHGSEGQFRRCIECKRIYTQEGVNVEHGERRDQTVPPAT